MPPRLKRLFGVVLLLVFVFFYIWVMTDVGAIVISRAEGPWRMLYFALAGIAWIVPAGAIIWWMYRPRRTGP